ncbi:MAG: hypothetical protein ACYC6N_31765 [Pirellulaceae bacterium]
MRTLCIVVLLFFGQTAMAQVAFDTWQTSFFYPEVADLLPSDKEGFRIGHVIFAYDEFPSFDVKGVALKDLPPVAEIVALAKPNAKLRRLVTGQLGQRHHFRLELVTLDLEGDEVTGVTVQWYLSPSMGGSSGVPFRYTSKLTSMLQLVQPERYVFDAYCVGATDWFCSTLILPKCTPETGTTIKSESAQEIAETTMKQFASGLVADVRGEALQMRVAKTEEIHLPCPECKKEKTDCRTVWAVNFVRNADQLDDSIQRFTIWVSGEGRPSELQLLRLDENSGAFVRPGNVEERSVNTRERGSSRHER